jgi:ABC-type branched-subunit amino acid transport system substrate-binding protein
MRHGDREPRLVRLAAIFNSARLRNGLVAVLSGGLALVLAACSISGGSQLSSGLSAPDGSLKPLTAPTNGALKVKVAVLLPLTGTAQSAAVSKGMKQAAEMALFELNNPGFQLIVKDTQGTANGAAAAATSAISEGVELIIGPLYARSVVAVAQVARPAKMPVIAFSNDRKVAGNGVYLLSFMAEEEVSRIVSFASSRGKRTYAALVPENSYGELMARSFRSAVAQQNGLVVALEKYPVNTNGMLEPSQRLFKLVKDSAERGQPVDAIFLPGGPDTLPNLAPLIQYANLGANSVKFLGSGGWDYPNLGRNKNFIGSWYPAPDPRGWLAFSEKFGRTFGAAPPRIATLAYDAVMVAIRLATANPAGNRFTAQNLARPTGFTGVDGAFRFTAAGTVQHSLAVLEVQQFNAAVVDPASAAFPSAANSGLNQNRLVSTGTLRPVAPATR